MRSLYSVLCLTLLVTLAHAQQRYRTNAQSDDLAGPVKSVSAQAERTSLRWQQPAGPTLVVPIWCMECTYDPDGSKTKSGQIFGGKVTGQIIRLVRDSNGQVSEKFEFDAATGQLGRYLLMGPFGKTEEITYIKGKLHWRQTYSYDQYGNMTDWLTFDSTGKQISRVLTNREPDGALKEKSAWGADGQLSYKQTVDPATKTERFTTFDQFGRVQLTWNVVAGRLALFWETSDSPSQFGENFTETEGNADPENYACHSDGSCAVSRVHYEYADPQGRNPLSAEWRDSYGNPQFAVYYDYEIDPFRNWTYRWVWVWSSDLDERALYETDSRKITYWQK